MLAPDGEFVPSEEEEGAFPEGGSLVGIGLPDDKVVGAIKIGDFVGARFGAAVGSRVAPEDTGLLVDGGSESVGSDVGDDGGSVGASPTRNAWMNPVVSATYKSVPSLLSANSPSVGAPTSTTHLSERSIVLA